MILVRGPHAVAGAAKPEVAVPVDRLTLAKRRWRAVAEDGTEFGVDVERPLADGDALHEEVAVYVVRQRPEPVLEVALAGVGPEEAARLGWMIGNLHFPIEVWAGRVRVADDPAVRQLLERAGVPYAVAEARFCPVGGGHAHGHHGH